MRSPRESVKSARTVRDCRAKAAPRQDTLTNEQEVSDMVKRIYILERRMWESTYTGQPSTYMPVRSLDGREETVESASRQSAWTSIARFLIENRLGPVDYIARQFDQFESLARSPYPNQMLGDQAWQRYTVSKATKPRALEIWLRTCKSSLVTQDTLAGYILWPKTRENRDATVEAYLSTLYCDNNLPPIFVHCVAVHIAQNHPAYAEDAESVIRRSEMQAAVEYVRFRSDYDAVWQELIPVGFRQKAKLFYRDIVMKLF